MVTAQEAFFIKNHSAGKSLRAFRLALLRVGSAGGVRDGFAGQAGISHKQPCNFSARFYRPRQPGGAGRGSAGLAWPGLAYSAHSFLIH